MIGRPVSVVIALPAGDMCQTDFAFDLCNMVGSSVAAAPDLGIKLITIKSSMLPKARQDLVLMAMKNEQNSHILFLDSDMRFPRNTLVRLLARNTEMVGANYVTRRMPCIPVTFAEDEDASKRIYSEEGATDLESVPSIGFGCVLIDLDVFRALSRPWFLFDWDAEKKQYIGEDVYCCRKIRDELKIDIYVDHDLSQEIGHLGSWTYKMEHARELRDAPEPATPFVGVS